MIADSKSVRENLGGYPHLYVSRPNRRCVERVLH